jgi:hypothetical protein
VTSKEHVVLYVDVLGFAALTERYPNPSIDSESGSWQFSETSESASQFGRFCAVIDQTLPVEHEVTSMVFSDCAFMVLGPALRTALFATELMQHFMKAGVPVRMGLASGTFDVVRLSADAYGTSKLTRAVFWGTGIVRASRAEKCGGKGMRIFVDASMAQELDSIGQRVAVLPLPKPSNAAQWELSYLFEEDPGQPGSPTAAERDQDLWIGTARIRRALPQPVPAKVQRHYRETFAAINRMRQKAGRGLFKGSRREKG